MTKPFSSLVFASFLAVVAAQVAISAEYLVEPIQVSVFKSVFGQVQSRDLVPARARIGGTLVEVSVEEGDQVHSGQVIARVVDEKLELQLDALDASQQAVTAQLENAATNLQRAEQLFARGTIAKSRLDELQTQVNVLTNELRAVEAKKSVIVQQAREGEVSVPSAGRVLSVPVTQGSVILPGETIAQIAGGGYFLRLSLPERHAAGITNGDEVTVGRRGLSVAGGEIEGQTGRLVKVYPEIKNGRVIADVEVETLGDFFVGERFLVSIPIGTRVALGVPPGAIVNRHGVDYVTIAHNSNVTEVSVIPGADFDVGNGIMTEILTGLHAGDRVVLP